MTALQTTLSGDNIVGHTVTAAVLGDGLSSVAVWILQLNHLVLPASVEQGITAICMVAASYIMQKISG